MTIRGSFFRLLLPFIILQKTTMYRFYILFPFLFIGFKLGVSAMTLIRTHPHQQLGTGVFSFILRQWNGVCVFTKTQREVEKITGETYFEL